MNSMKRFLTPKWIVFFLISGAVTFWFMEIHVRIVEVFFILLGLTWLAITLHELGHIIFGKVQNFQFLYFITGPFEITNKGNRLKISENKNWLYFFGVSMLMPYEKKPEALRKKWLILALGGPIISLFVSIVSMLVYVLFDNSIALVFSVINFFISVFTFIPFKSGIRSDGNVVMTLYKDDSESTNLINQLLIINEVMSDKEPDDWDNDIFRIARDQPASIENISAALLLFYKVFRTNGFDSAYEEISSYLEIPVTKKNKHLMGFLIGLKQMNLFLNGGASRKEILLLQNHLSPLEPFSYYRGQVIIDYLDGNLLASLENVNRIYSVIARSHAKLGFYQDEKKLTKLLEDKICISKSSPPKN